MHLGKLFNTYIFFTIFILFHYYINSSNFFLINFFELLLINITYFNIACKYRNEYYIFK